MRLAPANLGLVPASGVFNLTGAASGLSAEQLAAEKTKNGIRQIFAGCGTALARCLLNKRIMVLG